MKELLVVSGKGGTGKTCLTGSFITLSFDKKIIFADCDVDAANLHLLMTHEIVERNGFESGVVAVIDKNECIDCGKCYELCRFDAVTEDFRIKEIGCEGCGVCARFCPVRAISLSNDECGELFVSNTSFGKMVHAKLGVGKGNSGKLVAAVRKRAKELGEENNSELIIVDGPPGIGCPVISSITGCDMVLIVTEPTLSGFHDMERVAKLCSHFNLKTMVCINKYDINLDISSEIEKFCERKGLSLAGKVSYHNIFTEAVAAGKNVVEYTDNEIALQIKNVWKSILESLEK